ncbi:unknown [Odoribacter sp. CAG:788]|jgi:hypothetical protein|nr:unknown [Odoribacter sp. CAG:788]
MQRLPGLQVSGSLHFRQATNYTKLLNYKISELHNLLFIPGVRTNARYHKQKNVKLVHQKGATRAKKGYYGVLFILILPNIQEFTIC